MVLKLAVWCTNASHLLESTVDLLNAPEDLKTEIWVNDVRSVLELLPSVISTPRDEGGVATTFHASFLFDERRCGSVNYIPFQQSHRDSAGLRSLVLLPRYEQIPHRR